MGRWMGQTSLDASGGGTPTGLIKERGSAGQTSLIAGRQSGRCITAMTRVGGEMTTSGVQLPVHQNWKVRYRAAVFERDKRVLQRRLFDAEGAIIARGRELLHATGDNIIEEREALDDALYVLRAFRSACEQNAA
jgi:hypothetical protein